MPKTNEQLEADLAKLSEALDKATAALSTSSETTGKRIEDLQAKVSTLSEEKSRLEDIVRTFKPGAKADPDPDPDGMPDPMEDPKGYAIWVSRQANNARTMEDQQKQAMEETRQRFYRTYPQLVGYEPIVAWYTGEVLKENPRISPDDAFKKIAEQCEKYIKEHMGDKKNTAPPAPHTGAGTPGAAPAPKAGEEAPPYNPEADTAEAIKEAEKARMAKMQPPK